MNEVKSAEIFWISRELQMCKRDILGNFLKIGTLLLQAQVEDRYKDYGEHVKTFNDFLREMDLKKSTAYNAMAVRRTFGDEIIANNIACEPTRLVRLLPLQIDETDKMEWIHRASTLPAEAFENAIKEQQGKVTTDTCKHEESEPWERCSTCGKFFKQGG